MKKIKILAVSAVLFVLSSLGFAQSDGFGVYSGIPEWLGIQYQSNNLRFGGGISFAGLGASADFIIAEMPIAVSGGNELSWYYGAGVGAGFWAFLSAGGFYIFPHALLGIEYRLAGTTFSFYGEGQLGASIVLAGGSGVGFGYGTRVGVIFR
ncbi:hypothetical protein Mterra_00115 [Calidithermus terrae]|uniref:Outer membrane protein beta-barrel domain protein n=1 Tax=Calidithermus terrae TaxID=1408545 RepID=A0A399F4A5_9DEIN|nr:hypothetical protein [Calidithermus terrae]RIH90890.1 hypothetical protein Mterra_00115 [Calidithermus terrae]